MIYGKKQPNTQKYDEIFKKEIILDIVNNGLSIHAAVRKYWEVESHRDIDRYRSTVRRWLNICKTENIDAFMPKKLSKISVKRKNLARDKSVQDPEMKKLLEENEYLRMENEYLKKLRALILEQELQNLSKHK